MVLGVRVHGDTVTDVDVKLEPSSFRAVPVPQRLGIPLMYKMMPGTGGDDRHIRSSIIVRVMADPDDGFAPMEWQYGGARGPAPPVVLARKDGLPFSEHDWGVMEAYIGEWLEAQGEAEEDRAAVHSTWLQPEAFKRYVLAQTSAPLSFLCLRFPLGATVVPQGLQAEEYNGREGTVVQYSRDRVGVKFGEKAPMALRPEKFTLTRPPPEPEAESPAAQDPQTKKARTQELERQEALVIASRFVECLVQDTFPEMGDLHLFGIGGKYQARATEVLAVWQGAVKNLDLTAEQVAEALLKGEVQSFFEKLAHRLAESSAPNATYARDLIAARFAGLEWDEL